jgi:hypothetical protein
MNKRFNNLKDEDLLKKIEKLIDGKNDRQRFADSLLGFCSRLIGVKPKPDADFQLSLKRGLLQNYYERKVESRDNLFLKLTNIRRFITKRNIKRFALGTATFAVIALMAVTIINPFGVSAAVKNFFSYVLKIEQVSDTELKVNITKITKAISDEPIDEDALQGMKADIEEIEQLRKEGKGVLIQEFETNDLKIGIIGIYEYTLKDGRKVQIGEAVNEK